MLFVLYISSTNVSMKHLTNICNEGRIFLINIIVQNDAIKTANFIRDAIIINHPEHLLKKKKIKNRNFTECCRAPGQTGHTA